MGFLGLSLTCLSCQFGIFFVKGLLKLMALANNGYVYWAFRTNEKNRSGPQRHKFPPACPKFEPLPKRFFSPNSSKALICLVHLRINRMNQIDMVVVVVEQPLWRRDAWEGWWDHPQTSLRRTQARAWGCHPGSKMIIDKCPRFCVDDNIIDYCLRLPRRGVYPERSRRGPAKKINGLRIVRIEIATVACGSFAMTL